MTTRQLMTAKNKIGLLFSINTLRFNVRRGVQYAIRAPVKLLKCVTCGVNIVQ